MVPDQIVIDRAQTSHARVHTKLVQHTHIGRVLALWQTSKAPHSLPCSVNPFVICDIR